PSKSATHTVTAGPPRSTVSPPTSPHDTRFLRASRAHDISEPSRCIVFAHGRRQTFANHPRIGDTRIHGASVWRHGFPGSVRRESFAPRRGAARSHFRARPIAAHGRPTARTPSRRRLPSLLFALRRAHARPRDSGPLSPRFRHLLQC